MRQYYTTGDLAKLLEITPTAVRARMTKGQWQPSATTIGGDALFTPERAKQIAARYRGDVPAKLVTAVEGRAE